MSETIPPDVEALASEVESLTRQLANEKREHAETLQQLNMRIQFATRGHQIANRELATTNGRLARANEELECLRRDLEMANAELREAMQALWGEMQLAQRIQACLLPSDVTDAEFEILGSMRSADEVGGDYYDIIESKTGQWIVIGDVSGHGVAAGLIMMMAQTAVRTAIAAFDYGWQGAVDPGIESPPICSVLNLANRVLLRNIQRISADNYLSIVMLHRGQAGTIRYGGLHLDMLVYRAATGLVEFVETSGIWLGITEDVAPLLDERQLTLGWGDALLLFTDGVTEARRNGVMLDVGPLAEVFRTAASQCSSANEIRQELLRALEPYSRQDDQTLLVLRQSPEQRNYRSV